MAEYEIDTAYVNNSNIVEVVLQNSATDEYINDATVTITSIKNLSGVEISGQTFPISMPYVAASNGLYKVQLAEDIALREDVHYEAFITAVSGTTTGDFRKLFRAEKRQVI